MSDDNPQITELVNKLLAEGTKATDATLNELRQATTVPGMLPYLKDQLTSDNSKTVNIAVHALFRVSQGRKDVDTAGLMALMEFFVGKSRDYSCSETAIEAVSTLLSEYKDVADDGPVELVLHELLPHIHTQAMVLSTKRHVYNLLELIMNEEKFNHFVKGSGALFPRVFLSAIDSERDPELVLRAFNLHLAVATTFDAKTLAFLKEELFDSLSAYFPILFTPPANCTVTRDELRDALHSAMLTDLFHEMAIPFLCSKLSSPAASVKGDSFKVLQSAACAYSIELLEPHLNETLSVVRGECLKGIALSEQNPDLADVLRDGLGVVTAIGRRLEEIKDRGTVALLSVVHPIVDNAVQTIETDSPNGRTYATLIYALCSSCATTAALVGSYLCPVILQLVEAKKSNERRVSNCISCIGAVLTAAEELCARAKEESNRDEIIKPLAEFRPQLAAALQELLLFIIGSSRGTYSGYVSRVATDSAATLIALGTHVQWITTESQETIYKTICTLIISEDTDEDVRGSAILAMRNVSRVDGANEREIVAKLLSSKDFATSSWEGEEEYKVRLVEALADEDVKCFEWALTRLFGASAGACGSNVKGLQLTRKLCDMVSTLTIPTDAVAAAKKSMDTLWGVSSGFTKTDDISSLIAAIKALVGVLPPSAQEEWLNGRVVSTLTTDDDNKKVIAAEALAGNSVVALTAALAIASLAAVEAEVLATLEKAKGQDLIKSLAQLFIACCSSSTDANAHVAATAFDALTALSNKSGSFVFADAEPDTMDPSVAAAIAKGYVVRDDQAATGFVARVLDSIMNATSVEEKQAASAVVALGKLVASPTNLKKSVMWQQRFFHQMLSMLSPAMGSEGQLSAGGILAYKAIAAMANEVPVKLVNIAMSQLFAIVTSAVKEEATVESGALIASRLFDADQETAINFLTENPDVLIALTKAGTTATLPLSARKSALEIVGAVGQIITHDEDLAPSVAKVKAQIVKLAMKGLEDKKRLVRQAAGKVRHYWALIE